jgi:AhpD family alkylhydroperoxidase
MARGRPAVARHWLALAIGAVAVSGALFPVACSPLPGVPSGRSPRCIAHSCPGARPQWHRYEALERHLHRCGLECSLIELVKLRASQINGCAYCIDMHTKDARTAGEAEQRLYLLDAWRESSFYSARERAALAWTEAVTRVSETLCFRAAEGQRQRRRGPEDPHLDGSAPSGDRDADAGPVRGGVLPERRQQPRLTVRDEWSPTSPWNEAVASAAKPKNVVGATR